MINYYLLMKPGIILGNLITFSAGFLLASRGTLQLGLFLATLVGLALNMASACVFNNYIDRKIDRKMERTKNRALAQKLISGRNAIVFAIFLGAIGNLILFLYTNVLAVFVTALGFFVYVVLYSLWKCHTIYGTAIGSIAGAIPPVVGYCSVSNNVDIAALILFTMMILWQMPHFFSIAMFHLEDYLKANVPVLPIKKGILRTKIHMAIYIIGFILSAVMLTIFNYTGYTYLAVTISVGFLWFYLCIKGFNTDNDKLWGRRMFYVSLLMINAICFVLPFDIL